MPHLGFIDKNGERVPFTDLTKTYSPERWDLPLAVLLTFAAPGHERPYDVGCSELAGDLQPALLKRRHGYWTKPEDELWRVVGTGVHSALEDVAEPGEAEVRLTAEIGNVKVGTRVDKLTADELTDWKTTAVYKNKRIYHASVEQEAPEWAAQLNYMRAMCILNDKPDPKELLIVAISKDWRTSESKREHGYPPAIFKKRVKKIGTPKESVDLLIKRVAQWEDAVAKADDRLPECEELYGMRPDGLPRRCVEYCPVNEFCSQFARIKEGVRR